MSKNFPVHRCLHTYVLMKFYSGKWKFIDEIHDLTTPIFLLSYYQDFWVVIKKSYDSLNLTQCLENLQLQYFYFPTSISLSNAERFDNTFNNNEWSELPSTKLI